MRTSGFAIGFRKEDLQLIEIYTSTFTIIWLLDDTTSTENYINDQLRVYLGLQNIEPNIVCKFHNVQTCIHQLCQLTGRCIMLFISRRQPLSDADYSLISEMPHVEYIYQLGSDVPCRKIRGEIFNNVNQLSQVESDLHILPDNLFTTSIENYDNETKKFCITQMLLDILQQLPCTDREFKDFIDLCEERCVDRPNRLADIRKYAEKPSEKSTIWWYTGDTINRIISKILRERNPVSMIRTHYFIEKLFIELQNLYISQLSTELRCEMKIYRGKLISNQELYRFQRAVGKFVITDSYVSTTKNKEVANRCNDQTQSQSKDKVSVLFVIIIAAPYHHHSKPMALIDQSEEIEVLLSSGYIFRVHSVKKVGKNKWEIRLIRDVHETEFEIEFYKMLWRNIPSDSSSLLNMLLRLRTTVDNNDVNESSVTMTSLLKKKEPALSIQLQRLARESNVLNVYYSSSNQMVAFDDQQYPVFPPIPRSRLIDLWNRIIRYLQPTQRRIVAIIIGILFIIAIILSIVLPITLSNTSASVSITDDEPQTLPTLLPC